MSSLTNPSRLLLRNSDELNVKRLLLVMPPADSVISELGSVSQADIQVFTTVYEVAQLAGRMLPEDRVAYTHDLAEVKGSFDAVVFFLQKSKPLVDAFIGQLCARLDDGGLLWLVGENGAGIKSWKKRLGQWGDVEASYSGCHGGMLGLRPSEGVREASLELKESGFSVAVAGTEVAIKTLPGVFSHGRLDAGTRLLLETLSKEIVRGQVLDFGCGAGVIGSWLSTRHNRCRPTLLDTDAMALESSRRTLAANNLEGKVVASHGLSVLKSRYDWIISNPPFHEGVKTRYDVTEQFLKDCKNHLSKGGQLRIVANSFLKYRPLIEETFGHCEELAKGQGFTIYGATLSSGFQPQLLQQK